MKMEMNTETIIPKKKKQDVFIPMHITAISEEGEQVKIPINDLKGVVQYSKDNQIHRYTAYEHASNGKLSVLFIGGNRFVMKDPRTK